jgi:ADP-heptose:LPS heptosyltransferase
MTDYKGLDSACVVFLHGIGDFVMLTPSLRKIKALNPSIRLAVVVRKELGLREVAENLRFVDEVLELSLERHPRFYVPWVFWTREYWAIRRGLRGLLRGRGFGRVITVFGQLMPTIFYKLCCPRRLRRHRIDVFASELGLSLTREERNSPEISIPGEVRERVKAELSARADIGGKTLVGIQRNTLDRTRFIDIGAVQGFVDGLNASRGDLYFVAFADPASYALEESVDGKHLSAPNLIYSSELSGLGGSLSLAALVDLCRYVVSVDSAAFNIAGALGKNAIGVFNTYKVRSAERALERNNIQCIDSPHATAQDLLSKFALLEKMEKARA